MSLKDTLVYSGVGVGVVVVGTTIVLPVIGFGSSGIVAGSYAAGL